MTQDERLIRIVRMVALVAMSVAVFLLTLHTFLGWFPFGDRSYAWYYPAIITLELFFILVQVWIFRVRRAQ